MKQKIKQHQDKISKLRKKKRHDNIKTDNEIIHHKKKILSYQEYLNRKKIFT